MTDKNIRDLPRTSVVTSSDVIHLNQGGLDRSITTPDFLSEVNGGSPFNVTVIEDPSDSRTLSSSDINAYIYFTFQSTAVVTIPTSLSDSMKIGETITIRNDVLGNVVISGEVGVNISQAASGLVLSEIGQVGQILKVGNNSYHFLTGGTATTELTVEGLSFSTIAALKSGVNVNGTTISDWGDFLGQKVSVVVSNIINNEGGADYTIKTATQAASDGNIVDGIDNFYVGGSNEYVAVKASGRLQSIKSVRIPTDYPDLQTAADTTMLNYWSSGPAVIELLIESGHQLTGGLGCYNTDYSNIVIRSEDAIVELDAAFVGVDVEQNEINGEVPRRPLFYGFNAGMPQLDCVIDMGNLYGSGYFGVNSKGFVHPDKGVINSGFRGLQWRGGSCFAGSGNFSGATGCSARIQKAAEVNLGGANLDDGCKTADLTLGALYVSRSCNVEARTATIRNSGAHAILARRSVVTATDTILDNPTLSAVKAESLAMVDAIGSSCDGAVQDVYYSEFGAKIAAAGVTITNLSNIARAFRIRNGGEQNLNGATTVNGVGADRANVFTNTGFPNLQFNTPQGAGIIYKEGEGAAVEVRVDGVWQLVKYSGGIFEAWTTTNHNVNTGTISSGNYTGVLALPALPTSITPVIQQFQVQSVGRTSAGGGGNRVHVDSCLGMGYSAGEWKVRNNGVQLDGASTSLPIQSVQAHIFISGTY